jgi:hypothetical protein
MSGVIFIDDSRSDGRQFFGGEFVSYSSVLIRRPCRANFFLLPRQFLSF